MAGTRLRNYPSRSGLTRQTPAGPRWTGEVRQHEPHLLQALKWEKPRRIFWNAHGDTFHEAVPDEWIDRLFAVCALTPRHTHMVLTKRPERMRNYVNSVVSGERSIWAAARDAGLNAARLAALISELGWGHFSARRAPLPNVWLGVSVEDQQHADERIPDLLATPAAVRFLSCEPLLGPVDLRCLHYAAITNINALAGKHGVCSGMRGDCAKLDLVIVGGESGHRARQMDNAWAQSIVDQCAAAGVAAFVKQLSSGGMRPIHDMAQFPEGLRVREFPA